MEHLVVMLDRCMYEKQSCKMGIGVEGCEKNSSTIKEIQENIITILIVQCENYTQSMPLAYITPSPFIAPPRFAMSLKLDAKHSSFR